MKKIYFSTILFLGLQVFLLNYINAINSNPIISRNKPVFTSSGPASYLVDNKFGGSTFAVNPASWIAINIGTGASKVFFSWNNPAYTWSSAYGKTDCPQNLSFPINYNLLTSANSTNGIDGNWTKALEISRNEVSARGHTINFINASWIKMEITTGGGTLDEIEIFDASNDANDIWFFVGTSISANTYKSFVPANNYADLITKSNSSYTPAMVRGGVPCINTTDMLGNIQKYIANTKDVKFWAIEHGTNDAWGGTNGGVANFKNNLQKIIDACKLAGIEPIIARMIATNKATGAATWQVHPDYLKAIDELTKQNNLMAGPDLYTYFLNHPKELHEDGVHPNAIGAASIQRLWAEKMLPNYINVTPVVDNAAEKFKDVQILPHPAVNGEFSLSTTQMLNDAIIEIFDTNGKLMFDKKISNNNLTLHTGLTKGVYILKITHKKSVYNKSLIIQ